MDVLRHCAACSGRSADWFTLHNTHSAHQAAFYDAGLIGKYLSAWSKNFFVLDQLGGEYLQRIGVRLDGGLASRYVRLRLLDPKERRLLLARDPFGIKPLSLAQSSDQDVGWSLGFASELRALLASALLGAPRLDPQAVSPQRARALKILTVRYDARTIIIWENRQTDNSLEKAKMVTGKAHSCHGRRGVFGSHLCERLLDRGHDLLCVDNFFSSSRHNIAHLLDNHRMEVMRHDVTFPLFVEVDEIFNLACPASPVHYQFDPTQTTKTSVIGAINMLGLAKRLKIKILQASTSEIYGDPKVHPQTEDYWGHVNPIGLRSCYDEGKRCAETLFFDYRRQHNLTIKVMRIFNTYGPRMHPNDGRVVSNFIVQALQGENITIYGDGSQTRSFCYVDDLVEAMLRMMDTPRGRDRSHQYRQSQRIHNPRTG